MAFRGTYDYSLDVKNRLTVPAKFRAQLAGGVVLARNAYVPCIDVWVPDAFTEFTRTALGNLPPLGREVQTMRRFFSANSFETELDSANRVAVPPKLLEHAGLVKDTAVVGSEDHFELWNPEAWAKETARMDADIPDIAASLGHPA